MCFYLYYFVWTQGKKKPKPKFNLNGRDEHLTWPRIAMEELVSPQPTQYLCLIH